MITLVFASTSILVTSLLLVLFYTRASNSENILQDRLRDIRNPRRAAVETAEDLPSASEKQTALAGRIDTFLHSSPTTDRLRRRLQQANSRMTVGSFLLLSLGAAVTAALVCVSIVPFAPLILGAFAAGGTLPWLWLRHRRSVRMEAFRQALPDAIDLMARALRAGHSVQQTMELIAEQSPQPLAAEFAQVHQEQMFGVPFRDTLLHMSSRVESQDLHFVVTAILVQKETGGDLIEILDRTTALIRDRARVEGEVRVYTAQGRLSGWVLSLLPVAMLAAMLILSPAYAATLFHTPVGQKLLGTGCAMILTGCFIIRRIVDVEV